MPDIASEAAWITQLPFESQLRFLARLSFELTVAGRNSYEAGTEELTHPRQLRRVNEVQHRVTACLSQLLNNTCPDGFLSSMPNIVLATEDEELNEIHWWCWSGAKARLSPE